MAKTPIPFLQSLLPCHLSSPSSSDCFIFDLLSPSTEHLFSKNPGLSTGFPLCCPSFISDPVSRAACKVGFLFRGRCFSTAAHLPLHKDQIGSAFEYNSHMWGGISFTSFSLLDWVHRKAIRLIDDLTSTLQSLAHRQAVVTLSFFYHYYLCFYFSELASAVLLLSFPALLAHGQLVTLIRCLLLGILLLSFNLLFARNCKTVVHSPKLFSHPLTMFHFSKIKPTKWFLRECHPHFSSLQ